MEKLAVRYTITRPSPEDEAMVAECLARLDRTHVRTAFDDQGRYTLNSDEERAAQLAGFPELLERLAAITDENDTNEMWEEFERNIDEERRSAGMRTIFEGRRWTTSEFAVLNSGPLDGGACLERQRRLNWF